ncbi:MAG: hypothetical protein IJM81_05460 [Prevotella sp.]|nr:hypothetical protein [Prevotella sp.]
MKKKIYQVPLTEQIYINMSCHLLDWSAPEDEGGNGEEIESKRNNFDDMDFLDDEDMIEGLPSFIV